RRCSRARPLRAAALPRGQSMRSAGDRDGSGASFHLLWVEEGIKPVTAPPPSHRGRFGNGPRRPRRPNSLPVPPTWRLVLVSAPPVISVLCSLSILPRALNWKTSIILCESPREPGLQNACRRAAKSLGG